MSLDSQVLEKIRLMLDKPISPLSQKQILTLVDKQVVPTEQLIVTFYNKFRADLLIYATEKFPVPPQNIAQMLEFILEKLLKFKIQQVKKLWEIALSIKQCQTYRNQWGITNILQAAIKNTNEELKSSLFSLLIENTRLLWNWGEGRAVEELIKSYCRYFIKFNIYIASWVALLNYLLSIARQTKTELISRQNRVIILERLIEFLMATQNKQAFPFQNQCLKAISELLRDKNYKIVDHLLIHKCQKIMQLYLWKNPTRQQARKTQQEISIAKLQLQLQNQGKMQIVEKLEKPKAPPILIEKVIDKTNQYRARQHLIKQLPSQSQIRTASTKHTFLKRQQGDGGGKAFLQFQKSPLKNNHSNIDFMIQQCFSSNAKKDDIQGVGTVFMKESNKFHNRKNEAYNQRTNMEVANSIFVQQQPQIQTQQMSQLSTVSHTSEMTLQQNWQFAQISNLIDLAYQYKFQPYRS